MAPACAITDAMLRSCENALRWDKTKRSEEVERLRAFGRETDKRHADVSEAASYFSKYREKMSPYLSDADRQLLASRQHALDFYLSIHKRRPIGAMEFGNVAGSRNFTAGELPETETMLSFELVHHFVREDVDLNSSPVFRRNELRRMQIDRWQMVAELVTRTFDLADGDGPEQFRNRLNAWVTRSTKNKIVYLKPWPN